MYHKLSISQTGSLISPPQTSTSISGNGPFTLAVTKSKNGVWLSNLSQNLVSLISKMYSESHLLSLPPPRIFYFKPQSFLVWIPTELPVSVFAPLWFPSQKTSWVTLKNTSGHVVALLRTLQWFQISHIIMSPRIPSIPVLSTTTLLPCQPRILSISLLFTQVSFLILGAIRVLSQGLCTCLSHSLEFSFLKRLLLRFLLKYNLFKEVFINPLKIFDVLFPQLLHHPIPVLLYFLALIIT